MRLSILAFAFGVWCLQQQAALPALWPFIVALIIAGVLFAWSPSPKSLRITRRVALIVIAGVLGFGYATWRADVRMRDALPTNSEGRDIEVIGVVASLPQTYEGSRRFDFDVEQVLTPNTKTPAHVTLSWYDEETRGDKPAFFAPDIHPGERWRFTVRLRRPHGTLNPNGFDYEAWLLERDIRATGYVRPDAATKLDDFVKKPAFLIDRAREILRDRILNALPDTPYAGVLVALAIGDQNAITPAQWQVYTRTGVNHLMSISGLHITMISGLAFLLVSWLWRRSERLTLRLPARKAAALAGLFAALTYALLAGFQVPAQRTFYMVAVVAIALWTARHLAASTILALALFVVLLIDPWAVMAAGFWLSFGAVALIFYVTSGRIREAGKLETWARVQWAITLGLVPLTLALFQQVSIVSPFANAVAIPVVSLAVVPLTLIGMLLPFDSVLHLAHFIMQGCGAYLKWLNALPAAVWQQHAPPAWSVVAAIAGVLWLLAPRGWPARWLGVVALLPLFFTATPALQEGALRVTVLDVGQGLSVVVQTAKHTLLYDTGPTFGVGADSGSRIIIPFLRAAGVLKLDAMVVSHNDSDHSGGTASVLQAMPVSLVWSSLPDDAPAIINANVKGHCSAGQQWTWDGVTFEMLHPTIASYENAGIKDNNRSCVLKVTAPGGRVLLTGDAEDTAEHEMLARGENVAAEILIAPHHGSRNASSLEFVNAVHPQETVFTVGYRNSFHHPHPDIVQRYQNAGSRIWRSDRDGAVIFDIAPDDMRAVQAWRDVYRRYWLAPYEAQ